MTQTAQIRLQNMPIVVNLIENGCVAFSKLAENFDLIYDENDVIISYSNIYIDGEVYCYGKVYAMTEKMKGWLKTWRVI